MGKRTFKHIKSQGSTQYTFFQIPYELIADDYYKALSDGARLLYGRMLDRVGLSIKNGWTDEEDDSYIVYTLDEIGSDFNWGREKVAKCLSELENIGLIDRKRIGAGKPNRIYVNNFFEYEEDFDVDTEETHSLGEDNCHGCRPRDLNNSETKLQEVRKPNFKKFDNRTSRNSETELQEVRKSNPSQESISQESISQENRSQENAIKEPVDNNKIVLSLSPSCLEDAIEGAREQIAYADIQTDVNSGILTSEHLNTADMAVETIARVMMMDNDKTLKIGEVEYPVVTVKKRFLLIGREHVMYLSDCLRRCSEPIRNIQAYFLVSLFNAPAAMRAHLDSETRNAGAWGGS